MTGYEAAKDDAAELQSCEQPYDKNNAYKFLKTLRKQTRGKAKIVSAPAESVVLALGNIISAIDNPDLPPKLKKQLNKTLRSIVMPSFGHHNAIARLHDVLKANELVKETAKYSNFSLESLDKEIDLEQGKKTAAEKHTAVIEEASQDVCFAENFADDFAKVDDNEAPTEKICSPQAEAELVHETEIQKSNVANFTPRHLAESQSDGCLQVSFCQYCGVKLAAEARFCPSCGQRVSGKDLQAVSNASLHEENKELLATGDFAGPEADKNSCFIDAFIGDSKKACDFYRNAFAKYDEKGFSFVWSWELFFLGGLNMLYRKLYGEVLLLYVSCIIAFALTGGILGAVMFLLGGWLLPPFLLYKKFKKILGECSAQNMTAETTIQKLKREGGTNIVAPIALVILIFLGFGFITSLDY